MKCDECGTEMTTKRERHHYTESGLSDVFIEVDVRRCPKCGESAVVIPRILQLHRSIALHIVHKHARLSGEEIRFLRKELGLSGADFAARMGVDPATVSRWENDKDPIGGQADRLARLMVVVSPPKTDYSLDELASIGGDAKPVHLTLKPSRDGWAEAVA